MGMKNKNKIPDVFRHVKDKQKKHSEKSALEKEKEKEKNEEKAVSNIQTQEKKQNKRKSKNPFLPMRDWLQLSKDMENQISKARQGFEISKYKFNSNSELEKEEKPKEKKAYKIKYQDCLTLTTFKKKQQTSCLKKILHVPTLTVYYLRESMINSSIQMNDLEEWIAKCNRQSSNCCQQIIELYWNFPEGYYSILYEYTDGTFFSSALDNLYSLPMPFIQQVIKIHLNQNLQLFNSDIIIQRNSSKIAYLPIYEETADLTNNYKNFTELMNLNSEIRGMEMMEKKLMARLGFLVALMYFGEAIIDEDISNIFVNSSNDCCLIHKLLNDSNSLFTIYFESNFENKLKERDLLVDFLCKALKFDSKNRGSFEQMRKHKLLACEYPQSYKMDDLTMILETGGDSGSARNLPSRELSMHKMNKILYNMKLILQGVRDSHDVNLSPANKNVEYLVRDIGLGVTEREVGVAKVELVKKLKEIYNDG